MGIGLSLSGHMQIHHGALQCLMAQDFLDMPYGDIGFQQVRCIGVTKDMGMNMLFKPQTFQRTLQNPLDTAVADMGLCRLCVFASIVTQGGKDPFWIAVTFIVLT